MEFCYLERLPKLFALTVRFFNFPAILAILTKIRQFGYLWITVWKFHDFPITQILREFNFGESRSFKIAIFAFFEGKIEKTYRKCK